jgi:2-polyprenyl-3-methyl-5-hydroxy-6-metoxy-1,4-benzoquinol methylase
MRSLGWQVTGLDNHAPTVQRLQFEEELNVYFGTLPHAELDPCSYDVVTLWHSLEHVHEPLELLQEVYQLLRPGGLVVVSVPTIAGWPHRAFGEAWFGLDLPRHLTHFTPSTLMQMLQLAGLRVQSVHMLKQADWLRCSAQRAVQLKRAGFLTRCLTWKPAAKLGATVLQWLGQSDCLLALARRP